MSEEPSYHVTPFAQACLDHAHEAWEAALTHPFVRALASGELDAERFKFYHMQDARYLEAFSDSSALISCRCVRPDDKLWFIDSARIALVVESELHRGYGEKLGYTPADVARVELTPTNRAYQSHMVAIVQRGTLVEAVAAMTPCPWVYIALGQKLLAEMGSIPDDHPYADWLRMYSDPTFNQYIDGLLERLQRFADAADEAARARAKEAFAVSVRYEWMFWDQAWQQQSWPV
jgi:thiaminase/transcriptional activator TenA